MPPPGNLAFRLIPGSSPTIPPTLGLGQTASSSTTTTRRGADPVVFIRSLAARKSTVSIYSRRRVKRRAIATETFSDSIAPWGQVDTGLFANPSSRGHDRPTTLLEC